MENYYALIAQRQAVQCEVDALVALAHSSVARADEAGRSLSRLAALVQDHIAHSDPVILLAVEAEQGGRHQSRAQQSLAAIEAVKDEWCEYLYHWDRAAIAADWAGFATGTADFLGLVQARVEAEMAILYSLAIHHRILAPGK